MHLIVAELLEQRFEDLDRSGSNRESTIVDSSDIRGCVYHASLLLANHLRSEVGDRDSNSALASQPNGTLPLNCGRSVAATDSHALPNESDRFPSSHKRRRISSPGDRGHIYSSHEGDLPDQGIINAAISKYFATVHHWIPMLHERRFRARLDDPEDTPNLTILLHAIIAITLNHVHSSELGLDADAIKAQTRISADIVLLHALETISMENCQALIMLCFERMGSGEWFKAFSILGSLVRTVDYLGLTVEDEHREPPLLPPLAMLKESTSHAEKEERKRVFWNTFLLDRLCSIACGW